jgi:hypothetical protein
MITVGMRDHGRSDRAPGVDVEISDFAVQAIFSKPDHGKIFMILNVPDG